MLSACTLNRVQLFAIPWTVACQAPLSMEFSRQEYWSRLPFPPSGDFPDPGIEPKSLASPALSSWFFTTAPLVPLLGERCLVSKANVAPLGLSGAQGTLETSGYQMVGTEPNLFLLLPNALAFSQIWLSNLLAATLHGVALI